MNFQSTLTQFQLWDIQGLTLVYSPRNVALEELKTKGHSMGEGARGGDIRKRDQTMKQGHSYFLT